MADANAFEQVGVALAPSAAAPPQGTPKGSALHVKLERLPQTPKSLLRHPFYFQVPPLDNFATQYGFSHAEYQTVGRRTYSRPSARELRTVQYATMFVDYDAPWTVLEDGPFVPEATDTLIALTESGAPFRLSAHNMELWGHHVYDVRMAATLRSLTVEERAGEPDARYVNVSFSEWGQPELTTAKKGKPKKRSRRRKPAQTVTVKLGLPGNRDETLKTLSLKHYGTFSLWRRIARANGLTDWPPDVPISRRRPVVHTVKIPPKD